MNSIFSVFKLSIVLMGMSFSSTVLAQSPWTIKNALPTARYDLSAAVVNGKIYVMGGQATGVGEGAPASPKVEEYDPMTDSWDTTKASMPTARNSFSSSTANSKIYVFGGQTHAVTTSISSVEEYDPQTDTWDSIKTAMPDSRVASSASVIGGKIYVIGGWNYVGPNITPYRNVWVYDPLTDAWDDSTRMDMPTPRAYLSTSVFDGKIYAFGGGNATTTALSTVEAYDPVTNTWATKASMPAGRSYLMTDTLDGLMYVFGGSTGPFDPPMPDAWAYDPATNTWDDTTIMNMPAGLITSTCKEVGGKIYITGGSRTPWVFQPDSLVLEYDPLITAIGKEDEYLPNTFSLEQNYPNPFNPTTNIAFSIPKSGFVTLKVYNILCEEVATLVSERLAAGKYKYDWDAGPLASGVYLYRLQADPGFSQTRKLVLLK